jgi:hypothetical protein
MSELKDLRQTNKSLRAIINQKEIEYNDLVAKLIRLQTKLKAYEALFANSNTEPNEEGDNRSTGFVCRLCGKNERDQTEIP